MALALKVFMEFEAPDYGPQGKEDHQQHPVYPDEIHHPDGDVHITVRMAYLFNTAPNENDPY
jgi:hypothetical protein